MNSLFHKPVVTLPVVYLKIFIISVLFLAMPLMLAQPCAHANAGHDSPPFRIGLTLLTEEGYPIGVQEDLKVLLQEAGVNPVDEATPEQKIRAVIQAIVNGPTPGQKSAGLRSVLPEGTDLVELSIALPVIKIKLAMSRHFLDYEIDEMFVEEVQRLFGYPLEFLTINTHYEVQISVRYKDAQESAFKSFSDFLPVLPEVNQKEGEEEIKPAATEGKGGQPPVNAQQHPAGFLSGKSVFVSPGHGWYYSSTLGRWATQRPNTWNIIEDMSNAESCLNWLVKYLWNSGANVWPCRERDMNTNMVIVDNTDSGYSETGSWSTYNGAGYNASFRYTTVSATETATAGWTPDIPADGYYAVYVWYSGGSGITRSTDIHYKVYHTGGVTDVPVNQTRDGYTWRYVGTFHFDAGTNPTKGSVFLSNTSSDTGTQAVADAVRFGGGMGDIVDGGSVSGKPRWEESGLYFSPFMGCDSGGNTVSAMPRYAEWENESWEDSVYVSWHSNAFDGNARGTISFAYSSGGWGGAFNGVPGGDILRSKIHNELINDIRAGWDGSWQDRSVTTANFGEINPNNNDEMPASLHEMAFHDNEQDAAQLKDPRFRQLLARAVYQGIAKYFAGRDGIPVHLLPEPPTHFAAKVDDSGDIVLSWHAPPYNTGNGLLGDAASDYLVYISDNGKGFADGVSAGGNTTYTISSGLTPGATYFFRVTATNQGGESFPTETLAVRYNPDFTNDILIVTGFDRLDRYSMVVTDDPHSSKDLHREFLDRMNTYAYSVEYARAIGLCDMYFDSCSNEAVECGDVVLSDYGVVIWALGEESTTDKTFSSTEQEKIKSFLNAGGRLFVSGSEIGYDLAGSGNGLAFFQDYLKASYQKDKSNDFSVTGTDDGIFSGMSFSYDNGSQGIYAVESADVIAPRAQSLACLKYNNTDVAAVQFEGLFPEGTAIGKLIYLAFPFETAYPQATRDEIMARSLEFLATTPTPTPTPPPGFPIVYEFTDSTEGWTTAGAPAVFDPPSFTYESDVLLITTVNNTGCFGFWSSDVDAIPVYAPDFLYRISWEIFSDQTDPERAPTIRMRATSQNFQQTDALVVTSVTGGEFSPTVSPRTYNMYFVPPQSAMGAGEEADDLILNFDVYSFDSSDAFEAAVALDTVVVDALPLPDERFKKLVKKWDFDNDPENWVFGGSQNYTGIDAHWEDGMIALVPRNNYDCFGYTTSPVSEFVIEAGRLYRADFLIKTDVANQEEVPGIRLRMNSQQFWAECDKKIESRNGGDMSPTVDGTLYSLFFYPPQEAIGTIMPGIYINLDIMNFDSTDAPTGTIFLDSVEAVSFPVP